MDERTGFTEILLAETEADRRWRLARPLIFRVGFYNGGLRVRVPKDFTTDFASVPRLLWPIFPPSGRWNRAAIVHDFLYSQPQVSRFLADAVFREAMAKLGVPWWRRVVMYYAVRFFGRRHKR